MEMKDIKQDKWKTNPFAKKYKAKNDSKAASRKQEMAKKMAFDIKKK